MSDIPEKFDHLGLRLALAFRGFKSFMLDYLHSLGYNDLTGTHLLLLPHIGKRGTHVATLIEKTEMPKQVVSRALLELESLGYITLAVSPKSRRQKIVLPTDTTTQLFAKTKRGKRQFEQLVIDEIGQERLASLMGDLDRLAQAFNAYDR